MSDKPWWRDPRQLPPPTKVDRYLGNVTPGGLIFAGVLMVTFGLLAVLMPHTSPIVMTSFGGVLLGKGIVLRRKQLRDSAASSTGSDQRG